jgi:hypothetical protein
MRYALKVTLTAKGRRVVALPFAWILMGYSKMDEKFEK